MKKEKIVLAYSGGLDTSVILKWLNVELGYEVIAVCVDVGQKEDYEAVKLKALATGATKVHIIDAKESFVVDYLYKGIQAGAIYEDDYLLGTAYARPLIAKKLVQVAWKEGATAIAHGATGKGNDQVRFEATIKAMAPELKIVAPWRVWTLKSREDCIAYAAQHNIPIPVTKKDIYSRDENLWHISHEGGDLENPWTQHPKTIYKWCQAPENAPEKPEFLTLSFEKGIATHINGVKVAPVQFIEQLNQIGGKHGIGIVDMVENRLVGMKSRGVYETPGGTLIYEAHRALEKLVLDRQTMGYKRQVAQKMAELIYDGMWLSTLMQALEAFVVTTQVQVTGDVVLKLFKGKCAVVASQSPYALYREDYVTFGEDDVYNQKDAEGFINLFTLPLKLKALNDAVDKDVAV